MRNASDKSCTSVTISTSVRATVIRVVSWIGAACVFATGCTGSSIPGATPDFVESALANGLCLTQLTGEQIEIVPLDRPQRFYKIPTTPRGDVAQHFTWGRIAPNGAYVASRRASPETDHQDSLVGVSLDGDQLWEIKIDVPRVPAISRDAQKVVFIADNELVAYEVRTALLVKTGIPGRNPSWSPDGNQIAYDDGSSTYILDLRTRIPRNVGVGTEPSWSPTGKSIAVRASADVVDLVEVGEVPRRDQLMSGPYISVPRWSPDGEWMMYTRYGGGRWWSIADGATEPHQIIIRNVKTGTEASVGAFYKGNIGDYAWVANERLCRML